MSRSKRARKDVANEKSEQYATAEFWDTRQEEEIFHEWYYKYDQLKPLIAQCAVDSDRFQCLEIGCGFTPLIVGMAADGYPGSFIGIDFASKIIESLKSKPPSTSSISYSCMDARKLTYADDSIDFCIDKGTIDAMLCADDWAENVLAIISEMTRVLSPNGKIMIISHMEFESDEFQSILSEVIAPVLGSRRSCMWTLEVHRMESSSNAQHQAATVYVLASRNRRFTRSLVDDNADPCPLQIKLLAYDEEDGEECT